jgi:hypothetical protein
MKLAAVTITYKRPQQLAALIGCFLAQDHPDRELVILDDAGQYDNQEGDGWRLVSVPDRYPRSPLAPPAWSVPLGSAPRRSYSPKRTAT